MAVRTLVIANPQSRNGATGRRWPSVERRVREFFPEVEVAHTEGPRDAERLAREAVESGVVRLLVAGGDGTLSEVTSGLASAGLGDRVELGLLPLGTGGDFVRSLDVPRDLDGALRCVERGKPRPVDVGRLRFVGDDGAPRVSYFLNVASFGISSLINDLVNQSTKAFGGTVSFLIGTIRGILRYDSEEVEIRVDGERVFRGRFVLAAGANGRQFGGGMRIAPDARIDDGLLDLVIVEHLSVPRLLTRLPKLYRGTHLGDPACSHFRGRVIEADAPPWTVRVELDGEPLGWLPARYDVLPGALRIIGPA
ncbi:MAG: diacylglycerol/lipid kinase family protein [Myxococcota bacterium]